MTKEERENDDLALTAFKQQCEGKKSRVGSEAGEVVLVKNVFRNPARGGLIDAKIEKGDGSDAVVPMTSLFIHGK